MWYSWLLVAALVSDSMSVVLSAPPEVRAGEPVTLTLRVTNLGSEPRTLYLRGRPIAFDLIVRDARGRTIWRRLEGATTSMILQVRELKPGEALTLEDTWRQRTNAGTPVDPGEYRVSGEVLTDAEPLRATAATLRISR